MKTGNITRGLLIVSRNRNIGSKDKFGALLPPGYKAKASREYPTLFIFKVTGENWNGKPFWIPAITFPDTKDKYTFVFNLS